MKHRSPVAVFLIPFVTLGIYSWYWLVSTKNEMNRLGAQIPTAWIWLIPVVGWIWWYWKYSEGVDKVTKEKLSNVLAFILLVLLGHIGQAIIQDYFNKIGSSGTPETASQPAPTPAPAVTSAPQPPSSDKV